MGARNSGLHQYFVPGGPTATSMARSVVEEKEFFCFES